MEKVVEEYDPNESIEYYLDTELLNEYYSKKQETTENKEITVIDFMNKNKTKKEKLVTNYMRKIDDNFIKEHYIQDIHNCPLCLEI